MKQIYALSWFIQASLCKIQGLLRDLPAVFKDYKIMKNIDLHIEILQDNENKYKISVPLYQKKAQQFYTDLGLHQQC